MLIAWVLFPLLMAALSLGWGSLVAAAAGVRLPGALVAGAGMAAIVVVGQFMTFADATAELATPVIAAGGAIGLVVGARRRARRISGWALAAAIGVFAAFAAPIVLSGEATFTGFIKLDDSATWMALTDRIMEHGRSLDGLAPSSYETTLAVNLGDGYPVGVFVPLGAGAALSGQDVAWVLQPYMAFWAALLGLALWELGRPLVPRPAARAAIAFVAAQPALLVGYYLWGGIKEVAAAALVATGAGLAGPLLASAPWRSWAPFILTAAALVGILSVGGLIWAAPALIAVAWAAARRLGARRAALGGAAAAGALAFLCIPVIASGGLLPPTSSPLTDGGAVANLGSPLAVAQVVGVWPAGDFRLDPDAPVLAYTIIAAAAALAALGIAAAFRRQAWPVAILSLGLLGSAAAIVVAGSPWIDGKALATASVGIPFAAMLGACVMWAAGRRVLPLVLGGLLAVGVIWSNALAYREVNLAPRAQLAELERIGERIAGEGPTLMTEYSPYGVRHFLRDADPEGASELRRRRIPTLDGHVAHKGEWVDTDRLAIDPLLIYRTLVLRRSPAQSRPPSPYRLIWSGRFYDVWRRPPGRPPEIERLPLGGGLDPGAVPGCDEVRALARRAGRRAHLQAVERPRNFAFRIGNGLRPIGTTPGLGTYEAWLRGSVRSEVTLSIDGVETASARHALNNDGGYIDLGRVRIGPGDHSLSLEISGPDLHPGSGGPRPAAGPLVLSPLTAGRGAVRSAAKAESLCGSRYDWIEAVTR